MADAYQTLKYKCSSCGNTQILKMEATSVYRRLFHDCIHCTPLGKKPVMTEFVCVDEPTEGFRGDLLPIHIIDPAAEMEQPWIHGCIDKDGPL